MRSVHKLCNRPDMIGHAKRHRWRTAQGLMNAAQIIERDAERHSD
jgi:hypothetical protein